MTDLTALEARLTKLEDIEAARSVFHLYANTLDEPRADTVAALFTEDGVLHTPVGSFSGRDEVEKFYAGAFSADPSVKRHFIVNPKATWLSAGRVKLESYFLYTGRGDRTSIIGWGTYDDVVDVTGSEPRFVEKTISIHVGSDLATGWPADD
jgi:hypothetical protein